ncbi:hypothetical protein ACGFJ7_35355 [Actinoplanes sp. NPDC048988]|uniref:hypothetical protein n=1 Tax=Actinoplanes sp. NPDC048988 TaxID=3363901 RepID=UPI003712C16F
MNPVNPRFARGGLEPPLNDPRADRWLNSTGRTTAEADLARPTVEDMRREWQHHVDQMRRRVRTIVAVAAVLVAIAVAAIAVHGRIATPCSSPLQSAPAAVTP